jgi:phytoene dehydrogenase-like protein
VAVESVSDTPRRGAYDAVVIGSGPNGLAAAIELAGAGASVLVVEAKPTPGGGMRTRELTLPGFRHDVCSSIHPMGVASPWFRSREAELARRGLRWVQPEFPLVHPLDGGRAVVQERDVGATAARLGGRAGTAYLRLMDPLVRDAPALFEALLSPPAWPRRPVALARFGSMALWPATLLARLACAGDEARALTAGHAAHSVLSLEHPGTAAFALMLGMSAHAVGWPVAEGGSQAIVRAMVSLLADSGGELVCGAPVRRIEDLPRARAYVFDLSPGQVADIAGDRLPAGYRRRLRRFRHGPGVYKLDWALSEPIPWAAPEARRTACLHVGGRFEDIAASERAAWRGQPCARPFLIVTQPSVVDPTRAPAGKHAAWAYAHVPHGSDHAFTDVILDQMERFAPGFRDCILAQHVFTPDGLESYNANYVGGDVVGGAHLLRQLAARPVARLDPYATPARDIFLCSASTPPGAGVHGMGGANAARSVLRRWRAGGRG